jgi:hypothetical protein
MNLTLPNTLLAVACLVAMGNALADCAADYTVQDAQRFYSEAQQLERAGKVRGALAKYVVAQSYTCDTNPVEADAAKHAAALALPLGTAAERKSDFQDAFDLYDAGGHYAAADRALMSLVRAKPDDPSLFTKAREVLEYRALPAFGSNHKALLAVTGAYRPDAKNLAEVIAMPAAGVQRALQKETAVLSEQYLRDRVQLKQSVPDDPTDARAMQKVMLAQQNFTQKYSTDPLKASRDALDLAYRWSVASNDQAFSRKVARELAERRELRASTLAQKFSGDPSLLEVAIDYYGGEGVDQAADAARVPPLKAQALKLGDAAMAAKRYTLAINYYDVADADAKAQAARDAQQRVAMARMQPSIDQMKKQAEALQKQYSDPAKVQAMRDQARAMEARFRQQQQANAKRGAKKADELEKELGL